MDDTVWVRPENDVLICPHCRAPLNGHMDLGPDGRPPQKDDFVFCSYCRGVGVVDADPLGRLIFRRANLAEEGEFAAMMPPDKVAKGDQLMAALTEMGLRKKYRP